MKKHLYPSIYKTIPALLVLLMFSAVVMPEMISAQNSPGAKTEADKQDFFGERFREGRELIDQREWSRGAEKFREAVEKSPDNKLADAALYWLAFCYKKQKKYKEADAALNRLLEKFPNSAWISDAQVMKVEIAPLIGRLGVLGNDNINSNARQGQYSSDLQENIIKGKVISSDQNPTLADKLGTNNRLPLDRADEIKIAAFQSLVVADPKRAIETMGEILKSDSRAGENLKLSILRVWRNPRLFTSQAPIGNTATATGGKELSTLLRETLIRGFQNENNLKVRIEIIYRLASLADAESFNYLKQLYATEDERDIKKDIINSLGASASIFYPYKSGQNQSSDLHNLPLRGSLKLALDFLLEITRTEKDAEFRRLAFSNLRHFPSWWTSESSVETAARLYNAESDEEFKISLISALGESKQAAAIRKLIDIARNDKSDKLRLEAIYFLRNIKDPEVVKFLEDLIK